MYYYLLFLCFFYVRNSLTNRSDVFSLIIRDLNIKFLLKLHDKLNSVQRVCS